MVETVQKIINKPIFIDRFGQDHTARRQWRSHIEEQYGPEAAEAIRHNKLSKGFFGNNINNMLASLEIDLRKTSDQRKDKLSGAISNLRENYLAATDGYDDMSVEEKISAVKKVDVLLKKFLEELESTSSVSDE